MKKIVTHRSWNMDEIIEKLYKHGGFTACALPHYRFRPVQERCEHLRRKGLVELTSKNFLNLHYRTTMKFFNWAIAHQDGRTKLGPVRYYKEGHDLV